MLMCVSFIDFYVCIHKHTYFKSMSCKNVFYCPLVLYVFWYSSLEYIFSLINFDETQCIYLFTMYLLITLTAFILDIGYIM